MAQMHKAITIIQFKLEHRMKEAHPEWRMGNRGTLDYVDYVRGTYTLDGRDYEMRDTLSLPLTPYIRSSFLERRPTWWTSCATHSA